MTDEREPVIPRLLVAVALTAGFEPWLEGFEQVFNSVPMKEKARVEDKDQRDAGPDHHCKVEILPVLLGLPAIFDLAEVIRHRANRYGDNRAQDVKNVGLLRENH